MGIDVHGCFLIGVRAQRSDFMVEVVDPEFKCLNGHVQPATSAPFCALDGGMYMQHRSEKPNDRFAAWLAKNDFASAERFFEEWRERPGIPLLRLIEAHGRSGSWRDDKVESPRALGFQLLDTGSHRSGEYPKVMAMPADALRAYVDNLIPHLVQLGLADRPIEVFVQGTAG
jgi:hypothetical protein